MPKFEYSPTISLGNVISIALIFFGGTGVYAAIIGNDVRHDEQLANNRSEIVRVENTFKQALQELKTEVKETNRNLAEINNKLTRYELNAKKR